MTSKFTREQLIKKAQEQIAFCRHTKITGEGLAHVNQCAALFEIALAAMSSEPVALQPELAKVIYHFRDWNEGFPVERFKADYVISWMLANYPPAQPAKDREQVRSEHAEWSQATFGNVGPVGPLKHLSKEALEAAAAPGDLSEWADMQFLMWDAQRRAGITDAQITQAMIEKLAVNKQRSWPEPKDGEPRLHIKEQQAPVVEREPIAWLNDAYLARGVVDGEAGSEDAGPGYIPVYREAGPRPAPVVTFYRDGIEASAKWVDKLREAYDSEHGWSDPDTGVFEFGNDAQREYSTTLEELAEGIRALHPNAGNCRENANSSTNNCREITETSTNRSREHFISLCNEFWNWSEMDEVCAEDRGYELRMEWDGKVFKHPVTQALWRMYQAAPQEVK